MIYVINKSTSGGGYNQAVLSGLIPDNAWAIFVSILEASCGEFPRNISDRDEWRRLYEQYWTARTATVREMAEEFGIKERGVFEETQCFVAWLVKMYNVEEIEYKEIGTEND